MLKTELLFFAPPQHSIWRKVTTLYRCAKNRNLEVILVLPIHHLLQLTNHQFLFFFLIFIYLCIFWLCWVFFSVRAFSSCGKRGPLFIAVRGPLTITASLIVEHRLQTRRLSSCGSRAQLLRSMWDLPRPGLEPVSPTLAGRFSTTAPPGKPHQFLLNIPSKYPSGLFTSLYFQKCLHLSH